MEVAWIAIIPFIAALLASIARNYLSSATQGTLMAGVMGVLFLVSLSRLPQITEQGVIQLSIPWVQEIGLTFSFYLDGLSLLFALVITGIGVAVTLYAGYYFDEPSESGRFYALLMAFTGSMLLLVMAGNVITLFIGWEMTSIISFLLISFKGDDAKARAGALQALIVTAGGGLALLAGLLLLGTAAGSMELSQILSSGDTLRENPWYTAIAVLIFIGAFSKSAQWPLHFWLPEAMSAPTPASAFLHSATMVKAGIYLLARLYPVLGDTPLWGSVLPAVGLFTMFIGAVLALRQRDLKGCLAFSTVSQLGGFVALIGLPHEEGLKAAVVGILAHALYKGALFLVVGAVDHATGTRNLDRLGGLRAQMPGFAVVTALAGLSMAGFPPLFGFVAKESLIEAMLSNPLAITVVTISAALTVAMALILFWDVFMVRSGAKPAAHHSHDDHHHALPRPLAYGPAGLAAMSLIAGVGIGPLVTPLTEPVLGKSVHLDLFHGINPAFMLSIVAMVAGGAIFATRNIWRVWDIPALPTGPQIYRTLVGAVESVGDLLLKSQGGKIRYYLVVILVAVILLMATAGLDHVANLGTLSVQFQSVADVLKAMLLILSLGATLASILFKRHLLAALALGVAGYSIGGIFLLEPAPDVALVQFLVETLGTVLIIMILARTSEPERAHALENLWGATRRGIWRDLAISVLIGVGITVFALGAVQHRPRPQTVAEWHLANSLPETGASDVVAAIVTDFRGMDTIIEITVFGMAALGVLTLLATPEPGKKIEFALRPLRLHNPLRRVVAAVEVQSSEAVTELLEAEAAKDHHPVIAPKKPTAEKVPLYVSRFSNPLNRVVARVVLPVAFMISLAHILYGGGAPGDGFTAGVISGLAISLWYIVFGYEEAKHNLGWLHPARFVGLGLTLALLNAALPMLFGREFLAITRVDLVLPANLKLTSTMVYETAIFLTVLGGVSAVMEAITHPKEVEKL